MRDPGRIDRIIEKVRTYWKFVPDWRLSQLIVNVAAQRDPFHVEDDVLEAQIDEWIARSGAER